MGITRPERDKSSLYIKKRGTRTKVKAKVAGERLPCQDRTERIPNLYDRRKDQSIAKETGKWEMVETKEEVLPQGKGGEQQEGRLQIGRGRRGRSKKALRTRKRDKAEIPDPWRE